MERRIKAREAARIGLFFAIAKIFGEKKANKAKESRISGKTKKYHNKTKGASGKKPSGFKLIKKMYKLQAKDIKRKA